MKLTQRLIGAEIEYKAHPDDDRFTSISEYYSGMREVNNILLPGTDVKESLKTLQKILQQIDKNLRFPLCTHFWKCSYGYAFNGVHLHLSGNISTEKLRYNILSVIGKYGLSPRVATSWHVMSRPTNYGFKNKRKHTPIYHTPRGTKEIRILDVELFMDDKSLEDIADAIIAAYANEFHSVGPTAWYDRLQTTHLEDYKKSCKILDDNLHPSWQKLANGMYENAAGVIDFTQFREWAPESRERRCY